MVKAVTCPSCGGTVTIKFAETSLSCVCPSCLTVLSSDDESVKILVKAQKKWALPTIKLGQRYNFRGQDWEAIGYLLRSDKTEDYKWTEYLLFNPYVGYRFLVCMDGHWTYVTKTKSAPEVDSLLSVARYLGKTYKLFNKGQVKTLFVLGEFYWKIKANEVVYSEDYVSPPEMLSLEKDADEQIWSLGDYVSRADVEKAFKLQGLMPLDIGVSPHQPSPHQDSKKVKMYLSYLVSILFVIQFIILVGSHRTEILNQTYDTPIPKGYKVTTPSFTVDDKSGYIESRLIAGVNNNWFEVLAEVVNEDSESDEDYEYDQGVEYYTGYDSDGSWSEGSRDTDRRIAKLPPGRYHLNLTTDAGANSAVQFSLVLSQGNTSWGNFFLAIFLVCLYPIYYIFRSNRFEKERWAQSDLSPYWKEQGLPKSWSSLNDD